MDLVRIVDHALPAALFRSLAARVARLGTERLKQTYQTTFWFPLDQKPQGVPERCAAELRTRLPAMNDVIGVEWWLSRMYTNDVRVDFHQDRDERLALQRGKTVHPRMSSVLFLNRCAGGLLAVTRQPPNEDNPSCAPDEIDFALVRPEPNRFTFFEGDLTHGVLDANNEIPAGRLKKKTVLRKALILNWWHRQPFEIQRHGQTRVYQALR